jgi:hypothetical protein
MKALFAIGLVVLALGVASLFVPIPHTERKGIEAGGVSVDIKTHHDEKVSPILSGVMIIGGAGMMIAGARRKGRGEGR